MQYQNQPQYRLNVLKNDFKLGDKESHHQTNNSILPFPNKYDFRVKTQQKLFI